MNRSASLDLNKKSHNSEIPNTEATKSAKTDDRKEILKNLRLKNGNRLLCAQLNKNSIRNKFDSLVDLRTNNIDILVISEAKLDQSFPTGQFHIHGFSKPYRFERYGNGGGILQYICEDLPSKLILTAISEKRVPCCSCNPKKSLISVHLNEIGKNLDLLLSIYDIVIFMADFNAEPTEVTVSDFCENYNLKHSLKDKTYFKNPTKPTCIDLIVTNRPKCIQDTMVIETGLSD